MNSCAVWEHRHRQPRVQQKSLRGWWRRCRLGLGPRGFGDLRKVERSIARTDPKRQQIEIEGLAQLESARFDAGEQEQRHQAHHSRGDENHRVVARDTGKAKSYQFTRLTDPAGVAASALRTQGTRLRCRADTHKQGIDRASAASAGGPSLG